MHVLLVEDDAPLRESIASLLHAQGWRVDCAERGEPVPRSLASDTYDLVVRDIGLPGIDGLETLARVRAAGSTVPVLLLTARSTDLLT